MNEMYADWPNTGDLSSITWCQNKVATKVPWPRGAKFALKTPNSLSANFQDFSTCDQRALLAGDLLVITQSGGRFCWDL